MARAQLDAQNFNLESTLDTEQNNLQKLMNTFSGEIGSQPDLDFFMNDNDVHFIKESTPKKKRNVAYSSTKVKARNILTNVGYRRFKSSDFSNLNFIVDILSFLLQNFNPINIDRKVDSEDEQLMINFLWECCLPADFAYIIYTTPNYQNIADPRLTYQKANQIVLKWFTSYGPKNEICAKIWENFKNIHYIYSLIYPKIYNRINQFGIKNKSEFELAFSCYKVAKQSKNNAKQSDLKAFFSGKNPAVYEKREVVNENEQRPEKWEPTKKPKSPTVRGKAKEVADKKLAEPKADLKRRLDENTEKMEAIKKAKKNIIKINKVLK